MEDGFVFLLIQMEDEIISKGTNGRWGKKGPKDGTELEIARFQVQSWRFWAK